MVWKWVRFSALLLVVLAASQSQSGPADPEDQVALQGVSIFRAINDTIRVRVTVGNVLHVVAVPDSADGFSTVDTTSHGFYLEADTLENTWKLPAWKRRPLSDDGRQSFTLYLDSGNSDPDTMVARQVLLEYSRAKIGSVDAAAILADAVQPEHVDSTQTEWTVAQFSADRYIVPQVVGSTVGINAPYGTTTTGGKVFRVSGSNSTTDLGRAVSIEDWSGTALRITRRATTTASGNHAIDVDMSPESSGSAAYGLNLDTGGNGNVSGIRVLRADGYRDYTNYGIVSDATSGATTDSGGVNYAVFARAKTTVATGATNVGVYAEANGTNGKALWSVGESHLAGWVRWEEKIDVNLIDADSLQTFAFADVDTSCRCWATLRTSDAALLAMFGVVAITDSVRVVLEPALSDTVPMTIWCTR